MAIATAVAAASVSATAPPLDEPICADRPGVGSATCAAPKGHWQVEVGLADWSLTKTGGVRTSDLALGETAIKYGVSDRSHVELGFAPYLRTSTREAGIGETRSGLGDLRLRYKYELTGDHAPLAASFYPFVTLPTASNGMGSGKVAGGVVVPLSLGIGDSAWSLSASPEIDFKPDGDGHGYHVGLAQTLALNMPAADRLTLNAELWGAWDRDPDGTTRQIGVGSSAAYLARRDLQIDVGFNAGLNRDAPDLEIYTGISRRF